MLLHDYTNQNLNNIQGRNLWKKTSNVCFFQTMPLNAGRCVLIKLSKLYCAPHIQDGAAFLEQRYTNRTRSIKIYLT